MEPRFAASALSAALFVALAVAAGPARADETEMAPDAKQHLERGLELYEEQKYEQALQEFAAGYAIDPRPELLYATAQAERMSGDCASAVDHYERFLATKPPPEREAAARANVARCREALAAEKPAPLPSEPAPKPAPKPEQPKKRAKPQPREPAKQPEPAAESAWYTDVLGDSLVIAGAIALGIGTGYYVTSIATENDIPEASNYSDHAAATTRAERQRRIGVIGFGVGGALVAGGIVRYLLLPSPDRKSAAGAWWAPGALGVSYVRQF